MTTPKAIIFGVSALTLTDPEKQFFRYANPFGFILFQRNCGSPAQVKQLIGELREAVGRPDAPVLIDQEGGRVARLKPPHWPVFPAPRRFGEMVELYPDLGAEAARINARLIGMELQELGFNVNCAPLADVLFKETDQAIGDRAFSNNPEIVAEAARAYAEGLLDAGILPVIKHMPGHGRTIVDPHHVQSLVRASREELEKIDFVPFKALRDLPLGMTCHITYSALDPHLPCSLSPTVHNIIRNEIGFDGFLMSDDLAMRGVMGRLEDLMQMVVKAGSDVALHCNGNMNEMVPAATNALTMSDISLERWEKAKKQLKKPDPFVDKTELHDRLDMLLGVAEITTA
jgi:beta-N-acetylhexosaminidase